MTMHFIKYLKEDADGRELVQSKLKFDKTDLEPVMSKETLDYHFDGLAAKYFERYNKGEGDSKFNYGGATLHNLFFAGLLLQEPQISLLGIVQNLSMQSMVALINLKKPLKKNSWPPRDQIGFTWIQVASCTLFIITNTQRA